MRRARRAVICTVLALGASGGVAAQGTSETWRLSGSYLNLYTRSRTIVPAPEKFELDLNRLRLRVETSLPANTTLDVQYDNEILVGGYLATAQYELSKQRAPVTSFDLDHDYASGDRLVARHRIYRAMATWAGRSTDVKVGRQRIPLGTGFFWSPMDLLNPIDPTRLERDYRAGADAVLVQQKLGALARVDAVYVPATTRLKAVAAGYVHGNVRGADYSVLAGRFRGDDAVGSDVAFSVNGLGIRGEATLTRTAGNSRFARALLGADYGFENSLTLTGEAYYNGQGASDQAQYDFPALVSGRVLSLARWYGAVAASYQLTPLLKIAGYGVLNADDGSAVLWPRLEWSVRTNVDVAIGIQRFGGSDASEYGRFANVTHAEVRLFF